MDERDIKLSKANGTLDKLYGQEVEKRIRKRYTLNDELAIQRQRNTKKAEFNEYNAYCEECKAQVKELLGLKEPVTED